MTGASPPPSVRDRTPLELLAAAERLFAAHGIDGVSLRQIGNEAGHRNPAVVQYHFGSKTALLQAILEHRLPAINAHRTEILEALHREGRQNDLRSLVEAMARPLFELGPEAAHYVAFLARLMNHRRALETAADSATHTGAMSARLAGESIRAALGHIPHSLREHRILMAIELMVNTIANRQACVAAGEDDGLTQEMVEGDLLDGMVGLLSAPHTTPSKD
ncbi:hypothetical protein CC117_32520 [Parafrankia colletiae]|uniref:HTH tetR-type domain-containing protein n=1 Tax=Parafrankia colletiae TaxID=573497 RepID=A0A1S1RAA6_9ACTN|nr:TetR/AcrR family transcriptional regulator [Parafrankia colletiae]MCK9904996.1 TetR/AcrR family transcriptional regulator [Frankia sp. Cpl3]OHV43768.1 hypothetical protein CC117_32520 [Parafrankia colletiae]